jgi:site-specific DNA recombinase
MPKLAAIYARVSSLKQKEGETINSQVSALITMAKERDYTIPEGWIFKDEGFSGSILHRPALDELRGQVHEGDVNAVLVYSPDRLSRKYAHQLLLEMEFQKAKTELIFFNTPPAKNAEEQMSLHFKSIFAEYERAQISERCRRGRLYRAKQGNISTLPQAPYGYTYNKKNGSEQPSYTIENYEANIVRKIYSWYTSERLSISEIALKLYKEDAKSPGGNLKWHLSTIRDVLRNPSYTGTAYFGRTEKSEGFAEKIIRTKNGRKDSPPKHRKMRPKEMWIPISIPAIIDERVFQEAQERLDINKQYASRNTKEMSILQGLVVCGLCGGTCYKKVRGMSSKGVKYSYYTCSNRIRSRKCKSKSFKQNVLDETVWNHITELLRNPVLIEEEIARRTKEQSTGSKVQMRCQEIQKELLRLTKAKDKLLDAFQDGECLTLDDLRKRMKAIDQQKNSLEKELKGMQAEALKNEQNSRLKYSIRHFQDCLARSDSLNLKERQKIMRLLIDKIVLGENCVEIHHTVPLLENSPLKPDRYIIA